MKNEMIMLKSEIAKIQREQQVLEKNVKTKEVELNLKRPKYIKTKEKVAQGEGIGFRHPCTLSLVAGRRVVLSSTIAKAT